MRFSYNIIGAIDEVVKSFCSERDPSSKEKIEFVVKSDGTVDILGNEEGWLYLAKICVEMAYCYKNDPFYHTHRRKNLAQALRNGEEDISFLPADE